MLQPFIFGIFVKKYTTNIFTKTVILTKFKLFYYLLHSYELKFSVVSVIFYFLFKDLAIEIVRFFLIRETCANVSG